MAIIGCPTFPLVQFKRVYHGFDNVYICPVFTVHGESRFTKFVTATRSPKACGQTTIKNFSYPPQIALLYNIKMLGRRIVAAIAYIMWLVSLIMYSELRRPTMEV